jgi:enoyl-[acyl-carrier protein] reductase I
VSSLKGKKALIMGVANNHSIAASVATHLHELGCELIFSHLPDPEGSNKMERRVRRVTDSFEAEHVYPCDVSSDASLDAFFKTIADKVGSIDCLIHSVAYANLEDLRKKTIDCSREGFLQAMDISAYSLLAVLRYAQNLMNENGSVVAMSYYGGEKVIPGYNVMGICKSALEMAVRYAALEMGEKKIRVNAVSAGPIKTLAASAVGDFGKMLKLYEEQSPLQAPVTGKEVASATAFLLSHAAGGVTGEVLHVDGGYHVMGGPKGMKT